MSDEKPQKKPRKRAAKSPAGEVVEAPADPAPEPPIEARGAALLADPQRLRSLRSLVGAALADFATAPELAPHQAPNPERMLAYQAALEAFAQALDQRAPAGGVPAGGLRQTLATNLRVRMARLDVNQRQLSDLAGISQRHISQIMNCATGVTIDVLEDLARALTTSASELLRPPSSS
jgi:DNA-binding Xre family transcriptional regulator